MKNYFSITELCHSNTADAHHIKNDPDGTQTNALHVLIAECLNPIRERYGKPITVSSGFRCQELNRKVGGVATSQHCKGEAADLVGANDSDTKMIFDCAKAIGVYDQLLFESNKAGKVWVHISHKKSGDRKMINENYKA